MIYSTNRTTSIGDIDVDVNESYFGEGAFYFMQEAAEDELALFENAIKTDIDEVLIGESVEELEALNENFVGRTVVKIKELMRKFIEWLKGVTRSALAKLNQFLVRDNAKFCKHARQMIKKMGNKEFKATGTVLAEFKLNESLQAKAESLESLAEKATSMEDLKSKIEDVEKDIDDAIEKLNDGMFEENKEYGMSEVMAHLSFLEKKSREELKKTKQEMDKFEKRAKEVSKKAEKAERNINDKTSDEEKDRLAKEAVAAAAFKTNAQKVVKAKLSLTKKMIKVARAVVTRAAGHRDKVNEGFEYSPEYIEALIEADNYEIDEMFEEISEAKKSDCDDDDIEDDEE